MPSMASWGGLLGSTVHPREVAVPLVNTLDTGMPGSGVGEGVSMDGA